jgi:hypothetical protein
MGTRSNIMKQEEIIPETDGSAEETEHIVKRIDPAIDATMKKTIILVYVVLAFVGVGTGFLLSRTVGNKTGTTGTVTSKTIKTDTVAGSTDEKTFKDSATGKIEKGGIDGEGTHSLVRDGGPSQTVYLISSVVDLDEYIGKNVKIWGQTQAAKKAAWLMDVGKIELLSTE